jgi:uncharacterized protein (DUF2267 family)
MKHDEFLTKVGQRADVSLETAESLTAATLRTLAERISGGEARDLAAQLHSALKPYLSSAPEPAESFGAEEFVRRVAERAGVDEDKARAGIQAVFSTVREAVTGGEIDDIRAQLSRDYDQLIGAKG